VRKYIAFLKIKSLIIHSSILPPFINPLNPPKGGLKRPQGSS